MKSKLVIVLCAAAALAGCEQGQEMNEPSGTERPSYEAPDSSTTNNPSASTNQEGVSERTNDAGNLPDSGSSATP